MKRASAKLYGYVEHVFCLLNLPDSKKHDCRLQYMPSGPKLAETLKKEGTFEAVEAMVREIYRQLESSKVEGGWHNAVSLANLGWTEFLGQRGLFVEVLQSYFPNPCIWIVDGNMLTCMDHLPVTYPLTEGNDQERAGMGLRTWLDQKE